ncbi:phage tail protein [Phascolarctobacterium succinatutens]|uniref:phage tail protein n=1 Tax=Phascolarctobacterium succinatutens TaxID=626940 RepID=UPI0023F3B280|nr:phage tail protein [Phascolarctobacterium succinatutens]
MLVGFMADIPFIVSSRFIRTFDDYGRGSAGRWAQHDIIGDKPVLEFIGPDIEKISFSMQLRADQGINPAKELEKLRKMRDTGKYFPLVIGGKLVTDNMWVIESLDESVSFWGKFGSVMSAKVSVTLKEYTGGLKVL